MGDSSVIELDVGAGVERVSCHLMPCTVHHDGTSQVEKYFSPTIKRETDGHFTSSYRGRPLAGLEMKLPEDYIGLNIVSESESEKNKLKIGENGSTATWRVKQAFDKFTYWNWDKIPSANDKIQQVFAWLDVANAINSDKATTTSSDEQGDTLQLRSVRKD